MTQRFRLEELKMSHARAAKNRRAGFTLPEILVAVAMVGVLSAVVLPTVIGQVSKGEVSRVVQDLQSVEQAATMFRNDVGKWPAQVQHLVSSTGLTGATNALGGDTGTYPTNVATVWRGPYLARGDATGGLETSGGTIQNILLNSEWDSDNAANSPNFVGIQINGLPQTRMEAVDLAVDGVAGNDVTDETHGKIRWATGTPNVLYYLTSPVK